MLEEAVKLDPNYAVAYAQLGWAYTWLGLFSNAGPMWIERAREALARADAADPNLAESHVVRHLLLWSAFDRYQILPAFEELRTAQRINPNVGHLELGTLLAHVGLVDEAMRELQRALEIDPTNASIQAEIPNAYWYNALYDDAIVAYAEARKVLTNADNEMNRNFHHAAYLKACVSALTGDAANAVRWLGATVRNGMPVYPAFSRDKCFDKVRSAPQFVQFMTQLKPVWEQYERQMR